MKHCMKKLVVVIMILSLFVLCSCAKNDGQKEYHEDVADIERVVLNTMDRYITFQKPLYDENSVSWQINIRESYTGSDNKDKSYDEICEQTVVLIEEYLEGHPEHRMNNYEVYLSFWVMKPGRGTRYLDYYRAVENGVGFTIIDISQSKWRSE